MVIDQKLLFQAPNKWIELGMSQTNCHSYRVFVSGIMMVICSNTWSDDLRDMRRDDKEWLKENCYHFNTSSVPMFHLEGAESFM